MSAIQVLVPVALIVSAETDLMPAPRKIRPLGGEKLVAAWEAKRRAERLRNAYKRAYRMPLNRTPEEQRAFEEVAAAYQAVIDTYPGTDIDASCRFRLAGLHGYHSDHVTVIRHLQEIVRLFPGTKHEKEAFLTQGVICRRSLNDPLRAMRLLEKVPAPGGVDDEGVVPPEKFTDAHAKYLAAQRELARCEAALGRLRSAAKRLEELKRRYPRQAATLDRTMSAIERSERRMGGITAEELDEPVPLSLVFDTPPDRRAMTTTVPASRRPGAADLTPNREPGRDGPGVVVQERGRSVDWILVAAVIAGVIGLVLVTASIVANQPVPEDG